MRFDSFESMLSHWAEASPHSPALRYEEGGCVKSCTYQSLFRLVRQRSAALRAGEKTCVGILSDGSLACVIEIFAAVSAGLQIVMLDENAPDDLLKKLIVYTDIDTLWSADAELTEALAPFLTPGITCGAGNLLFFTSGTTESAKAVVLTEKSLCASAWNGSAMLPLSPADTLLCMLPLGHVFGFVCGLLWGLSCGACVALGRGARHYGDDFDFFRPTAVSLVPMLLGFLLKQNLFNPELKLALIGAGDCPPQLLAAANAKDIRISFGYGLTETSSGVAISVSGDPYALEICPDDTVTLAEDGEILIKAPTCMMQGYYKRDADTAAVLQDGVLYTGDLGRFDADGKLHITGRKKEMLVLSDGTKLFLPEYEGRLSSLLGTTELAVTLQNGRPVLILAKDAPDDKTVRSAIRHLMDELPRNQQLTKIFYIDHPLPRTATGKLKRWEIMTEVDT